MVEVIIWKFICFIIVIIFFVGYTLLDGFDLGIGMMFTVFPKDPKDRLTIFDQIWPFWDGNEVWLIMGLGTLFAIFPSVYSTILSHFYLPVMIFVFAIVFRAVSFEFWPKGHKPGQKKIWETVFVISSFILTFLFWLIAGNILKGITTGYTSRTPAYFWDIFSPLPLALAITGMNLYLMHGMAYTSTSVNGKLKASVIQLAARYWYIYAAIYAIFIIFILIYNPQAYQLFFFWAGLAIFLTAIIFQKIFIKQSNSKWFFLSSGLGMISAWIIISSIHFPVLVKQTDQTEQNLTVYDATNTLTALILMAFIAGLGMLAVVGYTIFVYRTLRSKKGTNKPQKSM